ncbi:ABC transporter ATP-binding protein [Pseudovibrio sp. Tun.PSC04-5.I4]|uniref:ABC transporter ATP-binding protein n=1 Tax=Pseudovibrio sp. Tun.PSC04-5.I4 TaxID=1798213 RepID=UPI0008910ACB|nr:ABC transporter ATP-binding protein [Pseudovibrio sp. Tun.PSC04-5.I4]SDQ22463.1 carbohydrate ABC transporter ATP-binding protein, CUT1 family [Pseudovibrio sp. Tun.PSC04-5.I4]
MYSVSVRNLDLQFDSVSVLKTLDLDIHKGEFLVLLGASGCGKSTLLNCIAGLLDITAGQIFINNRNVTWEEPSERGIGMVFQNYALYPQMTVEGNLTFSLKNQGMKKEEIKERVDRAAKVLQIEPYLKRKPSALSGGQRQRVAIGRALVRDADVCLFDEPLSNLDAKLRADLRVEIKRLHLKLQNTMIYVTHDQVEAMTLADRIAVMKDGVIQQLSSPHEIYNKPSNKFVADFIGSPSMNFFDGELENGHFTVNGQKLDTTRYDFADQKDGAAVFGVRPEHVATGHELEGMPIQAEVTAALVEPMGSDTLVWTSFAGSPLRFRMDGQAIVNKGDVIRIGIDPKRSSFFAKDTEQRL